MIQATGRVTGQGVAALVTGKGQPIGRPVFIIGLTTTDMERLLAGGEVRLDPQDKGMPGPLIHLIAGPDDDTIKQRIVPRRGN